MSRVVVVIVTYNSARTIERCLESVARAIEGMEARVVVVDNASGDSTLEQIKNQKSKIKSLVVIENERNVGFASAVNQGVAAAGGPSTMATPAATPRRASSGNGVVLLLNPDTVVEGDVIAKTVAWMSKHPEVGVAGPVLLNEDGSLQPSVRRFPTLWVILGMMLKLQKVFPNWRMFREYFAEDVANECARSLGLARYRTVPGLARDDEKTIPYSLFSIPSAIAVDQVMGAAFFINGKCWRELGGLDERFFLWFEEVDFCKRAKEALPFDTAQGKLASAKGGSAFGGQGIISEKSEFAKGGAVGWKVVWLPFAAIRHIGGLSFAARSRFQNQVQFFRSAFQYLQKHQVPLPFGIDRRVFWGTLAICGMVQLLSFWVFLNPSLAWGAFLLVVGATLVVAFQSPRGAIAIMMAELVIGSKGYLLALPMFGEPLSLRMGIYVALLGVWPARVLMGKGALLPSGFGRSRIALLYSLLGLSVLWGIFQALMNGNGAGAIFFDANAWLFLLLLLPVLDGIRTRSDFSFLLSVVLGAAAALSFQSMLLLYVFSHDFELLWLPMLYRWVRTTGTFEVTQLGSGFWRIFAQSHLYVFLALVVWIAMGRRGGFIAFLSSALAVATLLVSLSRSFWFGMGSALLLLAILQWPRWARARLLLTAEALLRVLGIMLSGLAIVFAVARFPFPALPATFTVGMLSDRLTSQQDAAVRSRWQLLPPLLAALRRAPILGSGFGATVSYKSEDPRVLSQTGTGWYETSAFEWGYLDVWLKMGLGGVMALLVLLGTVARRLWVASTVEGALARAVVLVLFFVAFTHIFSPYLNHPLGFGMLFLSTALLFVL